MTAKPHTATRGIPLPHLAAWRRHNGISQRNLAAVSHVSYASIARLETGRVGARPDTIGKLADALTLTRVDLINSDPEEPTKVQEALKKAAQSA